MEDALFFWSAGLMVLFLLVLIIVPEPTGDLFERGRGWIVESLGWFFILGVTVWLGFLLYLGLHTWTIFTLPGLAFAYFIYRHKLPLRVSSVFYPFLGDRIHGPIGRAIDVFAILGTLFGVAVSIGLGTSQINAGLSELVGTPDSTAMKVGIIVVLTAISDTEASGQA